MAAMAAALLFWTPICLLQNVAGYASTFVAQYTGAGQHHRVGPAVWQALYFAVGAGLPAAAGTPSAPSFLSKGWSKVRAGSRCNRIREQA